MMIISFFIDRLQYTTRFTLRNSFEVVLIHSSIIVLINREFGAGSRVLLDEDLKLLGIYYKRIRGHETQVKSHFSVASAVNWGEADVGIGIEKIAKQIDGGCVCPKTRPPSFCIKSKLEEQIYY